MRCPICGSYRNEERGDRLWCNDCGTCFAHTDEMPDVEEDDEDYDCDDVDFVN